MAEPKLTYGLDSNGRIVHVDDVPRGMACKCMCSECGAPLEARQGNINQWHFAHYGEDCGKARMTTLHMLAQQIIEDERKIRTPWFKDYYEDPSKLIYFESVLLEQRFKTTESNRRPDCVGIIKKGDIEYKVWIEIKVKHAIDEEKKKDIIRPWLKFGAKEDANKIIQLIKNDPYNKQELPYTIYELLIPNNDFVSWVKRSPKKLEGLELFYIIANFYTRQIGRLEIKDIDNELKKYRLKDSIDEIEKIVLEELVSLRVICRLRRTYDRYIDYPVDHIKEWYKKYITNKCFRNNCLKILSVEYGHIIGSNSTNFIELTEEIHNTSPDILPLYLMALDYRHQTKWPKYNIPPLDDEVIVKCREYVANHKEDEENEYGGILNLAYGYIFKVKSYIPNTGVELDSQIATDMPYSKNMSFEELVEGFAKIGEELNKQQY